MSMGNLDHPEDRRRKYARVTLDNTLEVVLVSDPETAVAAGSMDVFVGHFSDPDDLPGLAHFIEHMLFLGTEKYPDEASYQTFLTNHGGKANAATGMEQTNYHFDVSSDHLYETLQRFSSFFTGPLFTAGATERELNAINSEHSKNLQVDPSRYFQLYKEVSNPEHPFSKFGTGNLDTLLHGPQAAGINLRERMMEHYQAHYSANRMKLVVYGKEDVEELRKMVVELFTEIPNRKTERPNFSPHQPYTSKQLGFWYNVVPVLQHKTLTLVFPLPEVGYEEYKTKETHYLGHLVGHESEGSILMLLKKKRWAESLAGGVGIAFSNASLFTIDIEMTEEGYQHQHDIIVICFQYLAMLRREGVKDYVWNELKVTGEMMFKHEETSDPLGAVSLMSECANKFCTEHCMSALMVPREYNPDRILKALSYLVPENMLILLKAKEVSDKCDKESQWYGAKYGVTTIPEEWIKEWQDPPVNPELKLPEVNPFIPNTVQLQPVAPEAPDDPWVLVNEPGWFVIFKQDNRHFKPKAHVRWNLISPVCYATPRHRLLSRLMVRLVKERLNDLTYQAEMAHLEFDLDPSMEGMRVQVRGFDDKLMVLSQKVFGYLMNPNMDVPEDLFKVLHTQTKKAVANFHREQPYKVCMDASANLLHARRWQADDLLAVVDDITAEELRHFIPSVLCQLRVECYIHGNMVSQQALDFQANIRKEFFSTVKPLPNTLVPDLRLLKLRKGKDHILPYKLPNEEDTNSVLHWHHPVGLTDPRLKVLCQTFLAVIDTPFYSQLRTHEQLGYLVHTMHVPQEGVEGVACLIQSAVSDPVYLLSRAYSFWEAIGEFLEKQYTQEEFKTLIETQIAARKEKPKTLGMEADTNWREITMKHFMWDRDDREIAALESLTLVDLQKFFREHLANDSPARRRVATLGYSAQYYPDYDALVATDQAAGSPHVAVSIAKELKLPPYQGAKQGAAGGDPMELVQAALSDETTATEVITSLTAEEQQLVIPALQSGEVTPDVLNILVAAVKAKSGDEAPKAAETEEPKCALHGLEALNQRKEAVNLPVEVILDYGLFKQTLSAYPFWLPKS